MTPIHPHLQSHGITKVVSKIQTLESFGTCFWHNFLRVPTVSACKRNPVVELSEVLLGKVTNLVASRFRKKLHAYQGRDHHENQRLHNGTSQFLSNIKDFLSELLKIRNCSSELNYWYQVNNSQKSSFFGDQNWLSEKSAADS